ncbi:AAA-ATPase [Cardamine amara subsp. amara]|uniref:AAA-ATPase n=1 Tax=Cardamine amara subsp. amara TaxID=228776 RepID=A0ABD0ZY49_CARAN
MLWKNLRDVKLYSRDVDASDHDDGRASGEWGCTNLEHPSTFDTLAMDPNAKKKIVDDLERFLKRREFYKRVGKAWKRGYLLYGPPGTGKTSLIAAMANYLKFDVFDLELSSIYDNGELKRILLSTRNVRFWLLRILIVMLRLEIGKLRINKVRKLKER